jgi:iron complex outermembrane receptor protein
MIKNYRNCFALALILSGLCFYNPVLAQKQDSTASEIQLNTVSVNALSIPVKNQDFGGMIGAISQKELSQADPTIIAEQFNRIPGVLMQSGTYTTNRIAIRGVGSRSAFSTNKVRAYLGEIPLTDGGGETSLEDIDMSFIESAEIIKGPNSSLYGSGLGGVILLRPKADTINSVAIQSTVGSFGLFRVGGMITGAGKGQSITLGFQQQTFDGYRANNSSDKNTVYVSAQKSVGKNDFQFLTIYQGLKAFIPSALTRTDYKANPEQAAVNWAGAKGFEDYTKWLLGVGWQYHLNDRLTTSTSLYANSKGNYEPRPFNILDDKLKGVGMRSRVAFQGTVLKLNLGAELYADTYKWRTFVNELDPDNPGSTRGALLSSNSERRSFANIFLQSVVEITDQTHLESGVNLNYTSYDFSSQGDAFKKRFKPTLSPRLSVVQGLTEDINVFATVSHGFSPPSVDETLNETGGFNRQIQPETGWNREIGIKGAHRMVNYAVSYYWMDIRNLLVTRRTAEDVTFGKNAGSTRHNGLETSTEVLLYKRSKSQWKMTSSYSFNDFTFKEFSDDGEDYSGNQLTGVPKHQLGLTLFHEGRRIFSGLNFLAVGAMPITDDNSVFSSSYQLLNVFTGVRFPLGRRMKTEITYRMNNVFNEQYASMLNVNAQAFGAGEPRYYYPGMPRNHQMTWRIHY